MPKQPISNLIVISDTHFGCQMALFPPKFQLDGGPIVSQSKEQAELWKRWQYFWGNWVPRVTRGEKFAVVHCGDVVDGVHHKVNSLISANHADQFKIAVDVLKPIVAACEGRFYVIRGTPVHSGESGENEERIAKALGAIPDSKGNHTHYDLWLEIGKQRGLINIMHHIGTSGSMAYESSAPMRELSEIYVDSARWGGKKPDVVVRAHRHRHIEIKAPTDNIYGTVFTCAAWQLKTSFAHKIAGARTNTPMIGGSLIRQGDEELYTRHMTWPVLRPAPQRLTL